MKFTGAHLEVWVPKDERVLLANETFRKLVLKLHIYTSIAGSTDNGNGVCISSSP